MQTLVNLAVLFAVLAAVLGVLIALFSGGRPLIDRMIFSRVDFAAELLRGNVAVAIVVAAIVLGICLVGSRAVGADVNRYDDAFRIQARLRFGYAQDWRWFKAQGMTESRLDPSVCSAAGACGLMQLMPGTAVGMGVRNRFDAAQSVRAGVAYDRALWRMFSAPRADAERLAVMFSAYNWGAGNMIRKAEPCARARSGGDPSLRSVQAPTFAQLAPCLPPETRAYYPRIHAWRERFSRAG